MTNPMVKIVDLETGEEVIREMNSEELAQLEADQAEALVIASAKAAQAAEKAALLAQLGITEDQAKLLLS